MQLRYPEGKPEPVRSVLFAASVAVVTVWALSRRISFPVLPPIKTRLDVYGDTLNEEALLFNPERVKAVVRVMTEDVLAALECAFDQRLISLFGVLRTALLEYKIFCASS